LGHKSRLRRACIAAIEWKWFERIILAMIALNTVKLAMFDPFDTPELRPQSQRREAMDLVGKAFSVIFLGECVLKVIAMGLWGGQKTYLRNPWNCLDMFIVVVGILDFLPGESSNLSSLRTLRYASPSRISRIQIQSR
jgi:voltage-dependent calcium channel T type alpha-1G